MNQSIWQRFKAWIAKYDAWCQSMGLAPEQRRSCVPYRSESAQDVEAKQPSNKRE